MDQNVLPALPVYIPDGVCLKCQGCCRFTDAHNCWRPKTFREERAGIEDQVDAAGYVKAKAQDGAWICVYLDPATNYCGVYKQRPFECSLYPFVIVRDGETMRLAIHLSCPYAQETFGTEKFKVHVEALRQYFTVPSVVTYLSGRREIAGDYAGYQQELDPLFVLP